MSGRSKTSLRVMVFALLAPSLPAAASAAEVRAHVEGGGAHFLGAWQASEIGTGAVVAGGAEVAVHRRFGVEGRLLLARFLEGDAPSDPSVRRMEATGLVGLGLGFRYHPLFERRGPWIGGALSGVATGALARIGLDARIGWDFQVGEGFRLGPYLGYVQVLQPDDALRPEDARLAIFGVHGALGGAP